VNCNNGARFETYVIKGEKGSGIIGLNGPTARLGQEGDIVHILSYATIPEEDRQNYNPVLLILGEKNKIIERK